MSQAAVEGEVRGFRQWTESVSNPITNENVQEQVWTFQLQRHLDGRPLAPIPVEMRGQSFSGVLSEGHTVRLERVTWHEGQTVRTNHVYNVTLNTPVETKGKDYRFQIIISLAIVLAFVAFVIWGIIRINSFTPPF
jgi:hypothetical protein